jgi:hypothetical protein
MTMELGFRGVVQALRVSRSPVDGLFDWFLLLKMDQAIRLVKWVESWLLLEAGASYNLQEN